METLLNEIYPEEKFKGRARSIISGLESRFVNWLIKKQEQGQLEQ